MLVLDCQVAVPDLFNHVLPIKDFPCFPDDRANRQTVMGSEDSDVCFAMVDSSQEALTCGETIVKNAAGQLLQASSSDQFCRARVEGEREERYELGHDQRAGRYCLPQLDHTVLPPSYGHENRAWPSLWKVIP